MFNIIFYKLHPRHLHYIIYKIYLYEEHKIWDMLYNMWIARLKLGLNIRDDNNNVEIVVHWNSSEIMAYLHTCIK